MGFDGGRRAEGKEAVPRGAGGGLCWDGGRDGWGDMRWSSRAPHFPIRDPPNFPCHCPHHLHVWLHLALFGPWSPIAGWEEFFKNKIAVRTLSMKSTLAMKFKCTAQNSIGTMLWSRTYPSCIAETTYAEHQATPYFRLSPIPWQPLF